MACPWWSSRRSERAGYAMADLFDPQEAPAPDEQADEPTPAPPATRSCKPKKRASKGPRPLPSHLPRQPSRHDDKPEDLAWLEQQDWPLEEIDLEVTETLEYQPGGLATLLTILETCKQNGVNPREYLVDVLTGSTTTAPIGSTSWPLPLDQPPSRLMRRSDRASSVGTTRGSPGAHEWPLTDS